MQHFDSILYLERRPRGSWRSLENAVNLARLNEGKLTIAVPGGRSHRASGASVAPWKSPSPESGGAALDPLTPRWRTRMEGLVERARAAGLEPETRVIQGPLVRGVVRAVRAEGHDLVIAVSRDRERPRLFGLHPGDRRLLRDLPCTLWLHDPVQGSDIDVVLAAVDLHEDQAEMARRVLEVATSLASRAKARLHVVHAWSMLGGPVLATPHADMRYSSFGARLREERANRVRAIEDLLESVEPGQEAGVTVPQGIPSHRVGATARELGADVVVLGNSAHTGLAALLLRNLPESLVGRIPGSVLSIHVSAIRADASATGAPTGSDAAGMTA